MNEEFSARRKPIELQKIEISCAVAQLPGNASYFSSNVRADLSLQACCMFLIRAKMLKYGGSKMQSGWRNVFAKQGFSQ